MLKPLPLTLPERLADDKVDAAKGILILLVIFGHASNFWTPEPFATFSIKFFHVACFLLFIFVYDLRPISIEFIRDRLARYYIPFALFTLAYGVMYLVFLKKGGVAAWQDWLPDLAQALTIANAPMLDAATGLRALWFIPVLITLVIMASWLIGRLRLPFLLLAPVALALHLTAGLVPEPYKFILPFGLVSAMYLFLLGVVVRAIYTYVPIKTLEKAAPAFLLIALFAIVVAGYRGTLIKFPVMALPSIMDQFALMTHDIIIVAMFLFLTSTSWLRGVSFLRWCGQNSLTLYLTHLGFLAIGHMVAPRFADPSMVSIQSAAAVLGIFIFALSGGAICAMILNRSKTLTAWIMPRDWNSWPPVKGLKR